MKPDYWKTLTLRQCLNDAIHKFAQSTGTPYNLAWHTFETSYNTRYRVCLSLLRHEHALKYGKIITIPSHLEAIGKLEAAIDVAVTMTINSVEVIDNIKNEPMGSFPTTERQVRPLVNLDIEQQEEVTPC